jgi:hypothetical protein
MTYLIIGIALLFVIAPIFAILPSRRQKEQMRLRRSAMSKGISVELTRIQDPNPHQDKYLTNTGKPLDPILSVAAYRKVRPRPKQLRISPRIDWTLENGEALSPELPGNWHWKPGKPAGLSDEFESFLGQQLVSLPSDLVKIDEKNYFLSVYWHESSGDEGLSSIVRFLDACTKQLPYKPSDDIV